jgi:hypothetical protein
MIIKNKVQKDSKVVKKVVNKISILKFSSEDPDTYDGFDPLTNFCVIVPFQEIFLFVEVSGFDDNLKIQFKLSGIVSENDLDANLSTVTFPNMISVGELTLHENIVINYNEMLRLDMSSYKSNSRIFDAELFNIRELKKICSQALQQLLCNRMFALNKDFYIEVGLGFNL